MSDMELTQEYAEAVMSEFRKVADSLPATERRRRVLAALLLMTAEELVPGVLGEYAGLRAAERRPAARKEDSYEYIDDELSVRTVNALTRRGAEYHTKEQILNMRVHPLLNFGRTSFVNLVDSLLKSATPAETIRQSVMWQSAPELWRERAEQKTSVGKGHA